MNKLMQMIDDHNGFLIFLSPTADDSRRLYVTLLLQCVCLLFTLPTFSLGCQLPALQELLRLSLQSITHACQMLGLHDSSSMLLLKLHTMRAQSLRSHVALTQGPTVCAPLPLIPHASLPVFECCIAFCRQSLRDSERTQRLKLVLP